MSSLTTSSCSWTNDSTGSLFPLYSSLLKPVSDENFIAFHSIDRQLFSSLIFNHGREAGESLHVMAFLLWLERESYCPMKLVYRILNELPAPLVPRVANEATLCLRCIKNEHFIFSGEEEVGERHISLLQSLMEEKKISLRQLHGNRITVLSEITSIANEICRRAFKDILDPIFGAASEAGSSRSTNNMQQHASNTLVMPMPPPVMGIPYYPPPNVVEIPNRRPIMEMSNQLLPVEAVRNDFNPYEMLHMQQQQHQQQIHDMNEVVNRELGERMVQIRISEHQEAENLQVQVPADDRTIFLTFSKGYPISEMEVREFFTRKFGDFIEAIYMQEVGPEEQSLFARIVCHHVSVIDHIAPRNTKSKFSINGKHVWARKYVKKTRSAAVAQQHEAGGPSQ